MSWNLFEIFKRKPDNQSFTRREQEPRIQTAAEALLTEVLKDISESRSKGVTSYKRAVLTDSSVKPVFIKMLSESSPNFGNGRTSTVSNLIVFNTGLTATEKNLPLVMEFIKNHQVLSLTTDILEPVTDSDNPVLPVTLDEFIQEYF